MTDNIISPVGRVAFVHHQKPWAGEMGSKEKYQITLVFDKDTDLKEFRQELFKVAKAKHPKLNFTNSEGKTVWPEELEAIPLTPNSKKQSKYGDVLFPTGGFHANFKSDARPNVIDSSRRRILKEDEPTPEGKQRSPEELYAGAYARVSFQVYINKKYPNRVCLGLNNILKVKDGERVGPGQTRAEDDFAAYATETASSDDEFGDI